MIDKIVEVPIVKKVQRVQKVKSVIDKIVEVPIVKKVPHHRGREFRE